jgi:aarF domain-containing kinase
LESFEDGKVILFAGKLMLKWATRILIPAGIGYSLYDDNSLWMRHVRTITTVGRIVWDYKRLASEGNSLNHITEGNSDPSTIVQHRKSLCHRRSATRLLELFQKNGGVYVKIGQHLASMVYLLPKEYTDTLLVLQDRCPPTPFDQITKFLEQEQERMHHTLGKDMYLVDLDPQPLGVASLAQVHKAVLKIGTSSVPVAVKIQHPQLHHQANADIQICSFLVKTIKKVFPGFEFDWVAEEMAINLPLELDFAHEHQNAERTRLLFQRNHVLRIPQVFWSSPRLLVMEFVHGGRITDRQYLEEHDINTKDVLQNLNDIFNQMIFKFQYVHCDPHPGNLLIQPRKRTWFGWLINQPNYYIYLLDHGLYRSIDRSIIRNYARLWGSIIRGDSDGIEYHASTLLNPQLEARHESGINRYRLFASLISGRSWSALSSKTSAGLGGIAAPRNLSEMNTVQRKAGTSAFLESIATVLSHCPRDILLLIKTNDLLRSIGQVHTNQRYMIQVCKQQGWYCLNASDLDWISWMKTLIYLLTLQIFVH